MKKLKLFNSNKKKTAKDDFKQAYKTSAHSYLSWGNITLVEYIHVEDDESTVCKVYLATRMNVIFNNII